MTFTPTTKGSFLAGIGLWIMLWLGLFKLDEVVAGTAARRLLSSEGCFRWISKHRGSALLGTELVNYGTHGVTNPDVVVFAAGGTIVNALMIFGSHTGENFENFFNDVSNLPSDAPPDLERIGAISSRYGITILASSSVASTRVA